MASNIMPDDESMTAQPCDPEKLSEEVKEMTMTKKPRNDFSTKTWKEDFALIVEGKHLYVSSSILALVSPVFSSIFEAAFLKDESKVLRLSESYEDVVEFMRCIYPNLKKPISEENVVTMAPLAKKYQVKDMLESCVQVLGEMCSAEASLDAICSVLRCASACEMKNLRQKCMEALASRKNEILNQAMDEHLISTEIRNEIEESRFTLLEEKSRECLVLTTFTKQAWIKELEIRSPTDAEMRTVSLKVTRNASTSTLIRISKITFTLAIHGGLKRRSALCQSGVQVQLKATGSTDWCRFCCKIKLGCLVSDGHHNTFEQLVGKSATNSWMMKVNCGKLNMNKELDATIILLVGDVTVKV